MQLCDVRIMHLYTLISCVLLPLLIRHSFSEAEMRKKAKYANLVASQHFVPLTVESLWGF